MNLIMKQIDIDWIFCNMLRDSTFVYSYEVCQLDKIYF